MVRAPPVLLRRGERWLGRLDRRWPPTLSRAGCWPPRPPRPPRDGGAATAARRAWPAGGGGVRGPGDRAGVRAGPAGWRGWWRGGAVLRPHPRTRPVGLTRPAGRGLARLSGWWGRRHPVVRCGAHGGGEPVGRSPAGAPPGAAGRLVGSIPFRVPARRRPPAARPPRGRFRRRRGARELGGFPGRGGGTGPPRGWAGPGLVRGRGVKAGPERFPLGGGGPVRVDGTRFEVGSDLLARSRRRR